MPLDCPDACSLTVHVDGEKVVRVDGSDRNEVTAGFICAKVRRFPKVMYGKERLLSPGLRSGSKGSGEFRSVSWDDALDRIVSEIRGAKDAHGGEAILPFSYGGSNGLLSQDTTDARLFRRLGASHLARTVCAIPTGEAAQGMYGKMPGVGYRDYAVAKLIVVWGANPAASGIHLLPHIQEAQKAGAKLVVIDPRRTKLARKADLHLALRPGSDLPLALSIASWLFENDGANQEFLTRHARGAEDFRRRAGVWTPSRAAEVCGLKEADIESLARLYAATDPAVIRCGWGLERNRNGGSAVAAVLSLPAVAGKFGMRGGGYTMSNSSHWGLDSTVASGAEVPSVRTVNMNQLGRALTAETDPPVKVLFVYNCNPAVTMPHQTAVLEGLAREDLFTVVFDSFLTDTARYADVVLPATTFLERREMSKGYGSFALQQSTPPVAPVGESRTNHEVFLDLSRRLGLEKEDDLATEDAVASAILETAGHGERKADLERKGIALPGFGQNPVQFVDVFPRTADGKIDLVPAKLDAEARKASTRFSRTPPPRRIPWPWCLPPPSVPSTPPWASSTGIRPPSRSTPTMPGNEASVTGIRCACGTIWAR